MIGKVLCHTQVQTTARYAHLANESVKASGSRVGDSIGMHIAGNPRAEFVCMVRLVTTCRPNAAQMG